MRAPVTKQVPGRTRLTAQRTWWAAVCFAVPLWGCGTDQPATPPAETPGPAAAFTPARPIGASRPLALPTAPTTSPGQKAESNGDPVAAAPTGPVFLTVAEHVRVDRAARVVEFDGIIPLDCHDPQTPIVPLELICCSPDTREHESLVMTKARPSAIHAALVLCGLEPGKPGLVDFTGPAVRFIAPEGPGLVIEFHFTGSLGQPQVAQVRDWVISMRDARPFEPAGGFRFAGSRFVNRRDRETGVVREFYDADGAGTIIGLTTFGSELVGCSTVLSPDEAITPAEWICNIARVPPFKTPVRVRIRPTDSPTPDR
ncbi:MAG: YdjY domain-containing protein [Phycisphaerales bacterium]